MIDPKTFTPSTVLPSNIETKPKKLLELFNLNGMPPGFEGIKLGNSYQEEIDEDLKEIVKDEIKREVKDQFNDVTEFDPNAVDLTDGSLQ